MTASSVEYFPCRVQLMCLPLSTLAASRTENSIRPSNAKLKRISRNLFGSPDPAEMKQLYQEEAERQRSYVLQRYNFDTEKSKPKKEPSESTGKSRNQNAINCASQETQFPTIIEQELNQSRQIHLHEQNNDEKDQSNDEPRECKSSIRICKLCPLSQSAAELNKPYTRQLLLTEKFNFRKRRTNVSERSYKHNKIILANNKNSHGNLDVLNFPQCTNLKQSQSDITERVICKNFNSNTIGTTRSTSILDKTNSTTLSLQIILSADDLS
ncbi:gliolectin [Cochliomyia hominivorax]